MLSIALVLMHSLYHMYCCKGNKIFSGVNDINLLLGVLYNDVNMQCIDVTNSSKFNTMMSTYKRNSLDGVNTMLDQLHVLNSPSLALCYI